MADFKFVGLESRFERNWRNRFSIQKLIFESKIPNRNPISGFEVPILHLFEVVRCQFLIFPKPNFLKLTKFQILTESISVFSSNFDQNF